jgi:hypothetical protein
MFELFRKFTEAEKNDLLIMFKERCKLKKDYRFSVSHGAYFLGERTISKINHVWIHLNPDVRRGPFRPEEDELLLKHVDPNGQNCWVALASTYFPDRSASVCRARYVRLIKSKSSEKKKRTVKSKVC